MLKRTTGEVSFNGFVSELRWRAGVPPLERDSAAWLSSRAVFMMRLGFRHVALCIKLGLPSPFFSLDLSVD